MFTKEEKRLQYFQETKNSVMTMKEIFDINENESSPHYHTQRITNDELHTHL